MTWADKTLREFQDALASDAPTPGGGSAVGVALGQAAYPKALNRRKLSEEIRYALRRWVLQLCPSVLQKPQ